MDSSSFIETIQHFHNLLDQYPLLNTAIGLLVLLIVAWIMGRVAHIVLRRVIPLLARQPALNWLTDLQNNRVFRRVSQAVPSVVIQFGVGLLPYLSDRA